MRSPQITNRQAVLPLNTLCEIPNILNDEEAGDLIKAIDKQYYREWCPEGYDRRHRVQRYTSLDDGCSSGKLGDSETGDDGDDRESMEEVFGWVFDRIASHMRHDNIEQGEENKPSPTVLHRPFEVVVIEHTPSSCQSEVQTFEQNTLSPCQQQQQQYDTNEGNKSQCSCYIAQLTLMNNAIQSIEKPLRRELECWDLAQPAQHHETKVIMEQNGVIVKRGESLWNWRGRISDVRDKNDVDDFKSTLNTCDSDDLSKEMNKIDIGKKEKKQWKRTKKLKASNKRCIIVNFRGICQPEVTTTPKEPKTSIPRCVSQSLPLSHLLTVIVTTSPIRSHPSTEMLQHTFDTFPFGGAEFAFECPKVIVCDGCRVVDEESEREEKKDEANPPKITRKYSNVKQTLRNGIATIDQAKDYEEFKCKLRKLCKEANEPSQTNNPFRNAKVVELEERHGYGFALRHALYHCVETPYVCVIQHDRTFMRPTPIKEVVSAMDNDPEKRVKYVGMNMRSNLMYHDIFSGKYGRRAVDEFKTMIVRPDELCIDGNIYGANGKSVKNMVVPKTEKRRKVLDALKETYRGSHQYITYDEWLQSEGSKEQLKDGYHQLSLTPTVFWYDNTHIVQTSHYRDFIFHPQYKMVARGGFVEDKLSPCLVRSCERLGLKDGHAKFGCYLLDDHSGSVFTGHLDGGSYLTAEVHYNKNDRYAAKVQNGKY
mmetsp:Transcript_22799/g.54952  ORF Transcript_22799/g.54952 Transcript_22799/m.54952 type:complete len:708 (+) Transcript_22799:94-2217(+)